MLPLKVEKRAGYAQLYSIQRPSDAPDSIYGTIADTHQKPKNDKSYIRGVLKARIKTRADYAVKLKYQLARTKEELEYFATLLGEL